MISTDDALQCAKGGLDILTARSTHVDEEKAPDIWIPNHCDHIDIGTDLENYESHDDSTADGIASLDADTTKLEKNPAISPCDSAFAEGATQEHNTRARDMADSIGSEAEDQERSDSPATSQSSSMDNEYESWGYRDCGLDVKERFNSLVWDPDQIREPAYGLDRLLLCFEIEEVQPSIWEVRLGSQSSEVWRDRRHFIRTREPPPGNFYFTWCPWEIYHSDPGTLGEDPENQLKRYTLPPIDLDTWDFRLLLLLPHNGDSKSPLRARIIRSWMGYHSCYTAVRNTRGSPYVTGSLILNDQEWEITKNLETFLRHMRLTEECRVLWIRELCIDRCTPEERSRWYNWEHQQFVENCSCGILLMNEVLEAIEDAEGLEKPLKPRPKLWDEMTDWGDHPRHHPNHLGQRVVDEGVPLLPYKYLPLDLVVDEIRLVALQCASNYYAPLEAFIAHVPLYGSVSYVALSYTWGDGCADRDIVLNGQTFKITKNLAEALRGMRSPNYPRLLWIDALCIDQSNEKEKSRQIPRMQIIYDNAAAVFSWPGPNTKIIQTGMSFVRELTQAKMTAFDGDGADTQLRVTPRLARAWAALYEVFRQPFFRRRWIVQELASANLPNIVPARGRVFHWQKLFSAADTLEQNLKEVFALWRSYHDSPFDMYDRVRDGEDNHGLWQGRKPSPLETHKELGYAEWEMRSSLYMQGVNHVLTAIRSVKILTYVRHLRASNNSPSFMYLLLLTQSFDCSDPKDKIYALWNLATDSSCLSLRPDYSKSTAEVYMEFTKAYALHHKSLDIICATQFSFNAASTSFVFGPGPDKELTASWAPDWRQESHLSPFTRLSPFVFLFDKVEELPFLDYSPYHADRITKPTRPTPGTCQTCSTSIPPTPSPTPFTFSGSDLVATGAIIDTIAYVADDPLNWYPMRGPSRAWIEFARDHHHRPDGSKPLTEETETAYFSMLCGLPTGNVTASFADTDGYELDVRNADLLPPNNHFHWRDLVQLTIRGRRLIVTEKGYLGLAPWYARPGFKLAVLLGCSVPVVLEDYQPEEELEEEPSGWYFRGDAFVQGWMEGEMMREFGEDDEDIRLLLRRRRICIH